MKQYTNQEQTKRLITLGFPKPTSDVTNYNVEKYVIKKYAHSIGELIEFLPKYLEKRGYLHIDYIGNLWNVEYDNDRIDIYWQDEELINALYNACVELK